MVGKEGGKAKPLKASWRGRSKRFPNSSFVQAPKKGVKEYDEDDLAFLEKKKEEAKARSTFFHALSCLPRFSPALRRRWPR